MKKSHLPSPIRLLALLVAFISLTLAAPSAFAANLWWDSNGTGTAGVGTGTGTWGTSVFWTTDSTGANIGTPTLTATTGASDDLFFSAGTDAGTFTITNTGSRSANSLNFEEGTTTISGASGIITLTSGIINVSSTAGTTVIGNATSMKLAGTAGLTKTGAGSLSLNGNSINTFTGGLFVYGGTITLGTANVGGGNIIDPSNAVTIAGGNLRIGGRNAAVLSSQTFNGVTVGASGGELLASRNGSGLGTNAVLGTLTATATGGSLLVGTVPGQTTGLVAITTTSNKDATGIYGGRVVYSTGTANTGYDWATSATSTGPGTPNTLASYAAYTAMPLVTGSTTVNYSTSAGGTLSGNLDVNTLKVVGSATALALGANTLTVASGGLLSTGTTAQTISGTAGATRLTAGNGAGSYDLIVHQYNSGGLTIGAVIGNNGGNAVTLVKAGTATTLTLTGVNTYTGATYVNGGTLIIDDGSIGSSSGIVNTGTLQYNLNTNARSYANAISGLGALTKSGTNTLTLSGTNTYVGNTTISGGILTFANKASKSGSSAVTATAAGSVGLGVKLSDAAYYSAADVGNLFNATLTGFTLDAASGVAIDTTNAGGSFDQTVALTAGRALTKLGTGTLVLSQTNTHTGATTISAGTLSVGVSTNLGNAASNLVFDGGTLQVTGTTLTSLTSLGRTNAVVFKADKSVGLDINNAANTFTVGQVLNQVSGGFTKSGLGTAILDQTNTYTGVTTISAGTLQIGNGTDAGSIATSSGITNNSALVYNVGSGTRSYSNVITGSGTLTQNSSGGTLSLSNNNNYLGATLVSAGTLALTGSGTVNGSSGITVNGSGAKFLQTSSQATIPTVTLTQGILTGSGTVNTVNVANSVNAIISNNDGAAGAALTIGALTFNGAATVNTFSNSTSAPIVTTSLSTNAAGTVTINPTAASWANGTTYNLINYTSGIGGGGFGQFALGTITGKTARQTPTFANNAGVAITLTFSGDTPKWTGDGDANWNLASANNWKLVSGGTATTFLATDDVLFDDSATGTTTVTIDVANVAPVVTTFNNTTKNYTLTGAFGISSGSLTKSGTASLAISTANTYTGATALNAGTVTMSGSGTLGAGSALTLGGANLDLGATSQTVGAVSVTTPAASGNTIGNGNLTGTSYAVSNTTGNAAITANLLGSGVTFTKSGAGTVTLSGTNGYTGLTTVNVGALVVGSSGSLNSGNALTLGASGTADFQNAGQTLGAVSNDNTATNALNFSAGSGDVTLASLAGAGNTRFGSNGIVTGGISIGTVSSFGALTANITGGTVTAGGLLTGTISAGTVGAGSLSSTAVSGGAVTVTNLATIGTLSGSGTLGAGSLSATSVTGGTNSITGVAGITTLNGGTTTVGGVATIGTLTSGIANLNGATSAITSFNGGTVNLGTTVLTVSNGSSSGSITGANGSLTKDTAGTLTLSGAYSYGGNTTVSAGTLSMASNLIGNSANIFIGNNATLTTGAAAATTFTMTTGQTITGTGATGFFTTGTSTNNLGMSGNNSISNNAGGTLTLVRLNVVGANNTISAGNITATGSGARGVVIGNGASGNGTLTISGGASFTSSGASQINDLVGANGATGTFIINGGSYTNTANNGSLIIGTTTSGISVGSGTFTLTSGSATINTLVLSGSATSTSIVNLDGGTLTVNGITAPGLGTKTFNFNGGNLTAAAGFTLGSMTAINVKDGGAKIDTGIYSFAISDNLIRFAGTSVGGLTKTGAGTLTLSGTNGYTGATTITTGTLQIGNGTDNGSIASSSNILNNAALVYNVGAGTRTYGNAITGSGTLTQNSSGGTLILTGSNGYTGQTQVSAGTLKLNRSAADNTTIATDASTATTSDILINGGTLEIALSEQINNLGSINMSSGAFNFGAATGKTETIDKFTNSGGAFSTGANNLIGLGNTITWSGGTNTVNDGGSVQDQHIVISGGTNTVQGGATGGVLQLNSGGLGLEMSNGATLTLDSSNTVAGKLLLKGNVSSTGNSTVTIDSGLNLANKGQINLDGGTRTFTIADGSATHDMNIFATITNGGLIKDGAGILRLAESNTYTGGTTINAGTLELDHNGGALADSGAVVLADVLGARLLVNHDETIGSLAGGGTTGGNVDLNNRHLTVGDITNTTYGGVINGGGSSQLIKQGSGTLILTNASNVVDVTNVNAGKLTLDSGAQLTSNAAVSGTASLVVNGTLTGTLTTASGTALSGTGQISGSTDIFGTIAPGDNSIESLKTGAMTLESTSIFNYQINKDVAPGVAGDLIAVTGGLTLNSSNLNTNNVLNIAELGTSGTWSIGEKLTLISYTGSWNNQRFSYLGSSLLDDSTFNFSGADWLFNYNDTVAGTNFTGDLTGSHFVTMTVAIPEPSRAILMLIGAAGLLLRRRRKAE